MSMERNQLVTVKAVQLDADWGHPRRKWPSRRHLVAAAVIVALCLAGAIAAIVVTVSQKEEKRECPWAKKGGYIRFPHEHDELDHPDYVSADGTYMTQSVVIPYADGENEGAEIELTYEAKILQDWHRIEALDFDEEVEGITCADGLLTIHFASDEIAQQKVSWS